MPARLLSLLAAPVIRTCLFGAAALLCGTAQAQTPVWQAAAGAGITQSTGALAQVYATVADANGNAYITGTFNGTARFGTTLVSSAGSNDAFVAKWNGTTNAFDWVLPLGGTGSDRGTALALTGNTLYVAGIFTGTAALGGVQLISAGQEDGFVAKIVDAGSSGNVAWARSAGGSGFDGLTGVAVGTTGVFVTGSFNGTAQLGGLSLSSSGSNDVLVAKLTDAGSTASFTWAQRAGGTGPDLAQAIALSGPNVYVGGYYSSASAEFGGIPLPNSSLSTIDGFVTKLTDTGAAGNFAWAQRVSGPADDLVRALAVRGSTVYAVGNYNSATLSAGPFTLGNNGGFDVLVTKLVDAGGSASFAWAYNAGGPGGESSSSVAVAGSHVFLTGGFTSSTVSFGGTILTNTNTLTDVYLARLTDAGASASFTYALSAGAAGDDYGIGLSIGGPRVYVGGSAGSAAQFGAHTLPPSSTGAPTGFIATFTDAAILSTASTDWANALAVYPNPARHRATVQLPALPTSAVLALTDALGRTLWQHTAPPSAAHSTHTVPLGHLAAGVYYLHVQTGAQSVRRTLAVE
ncbi:T9SS type A sorting domain-containing protein [Hymenobacter busanensis]|uniref:T9SS type A sorting domain-containing protein n=1 Tax=Hymenobacter busanensis TaxID=2607656 RepID=A0A7L5A266_9BACT|nr:T9SS type A sorting domain-containing protein [Hymenobacter busanensis]KAA9333468.1 T9SS type A sorting domain-containing protein [Hymenobacter busanensis]QHJ07850.1 T9SS type A sorting domain-containing protein [Hymenobacter busanensis]